MAEELKNELSEEERSEAPGAGQKASQYAFKGRKTVHYLQKCKDKGQKLVQVCPLMDPLWTSAADMAGIDIVRLICVSKCRHDYDLSDLDVKLAPWWIQLVRETAPTIHINYHAETPTYCTAERGIHYGSTYINAGADSLLTMDIKNDVVKAMSDYHIPLYGHIGILSGWMTMGAHGAYSRVGKTAEDALAIYRMAMSTRRTA